VAGGKWAPTRAAERGQKGGFKTVKLKNCRANVNENMGARKKTARAKKRRGEPKGHIWKSATNKRGENREGTEV